MKKNCAKYGIEPLDPAPILIVWCLRIVLKFEGWRANVDSRDAVGEKELSFSLDELKYMCLETAFEEGEGIKKKLFMEKARKELKKQEQKISKDELCYVDKVLKENLNAIGDRLGLNRVEKMIVLFATMAETDRVFSNFIEKLPHRYSGLTAITMVLAGVIGAAITEVEDAIGKGGRLYRIGILRMEDSLEISDALCLPEHMTKMLLVRHKDIYSMLSRYFYELSDSTLSIEDYKGIADGIIESIARYIGKLMKGRVSGGNILIYGPPGTGKSELGRLLSRIVGATAYEVSTQDEYGNQLDVDKRMQAYRLAQGILSGEQKTILIFDEADDVLASNRFNLFGEEFYVPGESNSRKGWINMALETNEVATIWICNDASRIERAYLRRFGMILELPLPTIDVRRNIVQKRVSGRPVSDEWIEVLARTEWLSPANIDQAVRYADMQGVRRSDRYEQEMARYLDGLGRIEGRPPLSRMHSVPLVEFNIGLLNTIPSITGLLERLRTDIPSRLLFYGDPGTGKTEFARTIAESTGRPLLVKRASDLLDAYVGQTEKNIARMFHEARSKRALLVVDEADSFLRRREDAYRRWEVTQTNELLTQLERFEGMCVFTTNIVDSLDRAVLRRFDLKVKFLPLTDEQRWKLFCSVIEKEGKSVDRSHLGDVLGLRGITPGDVVSVLRGCRVSGQTITPNLLISLLRKELEIKNGSVPRKIGFMANLG